MTEQLKLPRVRFEGWQKDVSKYYKEASVYNCSAEVTDIIMNNGILIPPFRQEEYASRMVDYTAMDSTFRANVLIPVPRF